MIKNIISWCFVIALMTSNISCNMVARKTATKLGKNATKETVEKVSKEAVETASKKAGKEISEGALDKASKKVIGSTLLEYSNTNKSVASLYDNFMNRIGKDFTDGIVVTETKDVVEMFSKNFPNSAIRMNKNIVVGKGGSLVNSGPVNEFLNHLLPNKTYIIDDYFIYKTDDLGRVISCSSERSKAFKSINRNTQRNTDIQKYIVEKLDGRVGLDDGGHLFANSTGGPNELINQVPMSRELNRNGLWRELEQIEEKALKDGKEVVSQRNLLYRGNEKRPYAIEFITKIDGVETKTIVENI